MTLREFALGAGTRLRHIPMGERKSIAERLRKLIGDEAPALSGKVPPRMIRHDGEDLILHYRGNSNQRALKRPRYRHRTNEAMASWDSEGQWVTPRMNAKEKQGFLREAVGKRDREDWALVNTIGTSTNPQVAQHFRNNYKGGHFGVYATPISKIPDRIRDGKIGFPSRVYWEQEISQPNGGNLIKVRQYKTIGKTTGGWSISKRIRDFSANLRLREFSALRKRIRVNWHSDGSARMTIPNQHGGVNEIGRIETSGKGRGRVGRVKWVEIDDKFQGMGLASKMYGEAMKAAPRGRLVSDIEQFSPATAVWEKLRRNKGYKIRENPNYDFGDWMGAGVARVSRDKRPLYIGRINSAARMQWAQRHLDERSLRSFKPIL